MELYSHLDSGVSDFFEYSSTDGAAQSLEITGFTIISTNRDLSLESYETLSNSNIEAIENYDIILKKGVAVTIQTELIPDCGDYTL